MLMMDYQEFQNKLMKRGSKPHRLKHCLGSRDAFHWVRHNKWKALHGEHCDKLLYSHIIHEVHKELLDLMLEGHEIEFPYQMGSILLNCKPGVAYFKDGKVETNYKVDWVKTMQYLFEDPEALKNHERVKRVSPYIYRVKYDKKKAHFLNRRFYSFRVNRSVIKHLGSMLAKGRVHAEQLEYRNFTNEE